MYKDNDPVKVTECNLIVNTHTLHYDRVQIVIETGDYHFMTDGRVIQMNWFNSTMYRRMKLDIFVKVSPRSNLKCKQHQRNEIVIGLKTPRTSHSIIYPAIYIQTKVYPDIV